MKLFSLNTHTLEEPDYERKLTRLAKGLLALQPDVTAFQEVNQTIGGQAVSQEELKKSGYMPCPGIPGDRTVTVAGDNHGFQMAVLLREGGFPCFWTWIPVKVGYGKYDEGLAFLSPRPFSSITQFYLSKGRDYENWKTRKALGISVEIEGRLNHFFSLHMGWWKDLEEPFSYQWNILTEKAASFLETGNVWLMGDFNSPDHVRGEGFDLIRSQGWQDVFMAAKDRKGYATAPGKIDGWKDQKSGEGMRIDYIWYSPGGKDMPNLLVDQASVVFDGVESPCVSDHYGIFTQCAAKKGPII
mgnify:CR=1 FL=1